MSKSYCVDDMIYLNVKNIKFIRLSKKLNYKYYDSYEVEKLIEKQTYKLRLFDTMIIYNVFHVFLLKSTKKREEEYLQSSSIQIDDENE